MCAIQDGGDSCLALAHGSAQDALRRAEIDRRWDKVTSIHSLADTLGQLFFSGLKIAAEALQKVAPEPPQEVAPTQRLTDDVNRLLDLELDERINDAIPLRKEIKKIHGVSEERIAKELLTISAPLQPSSEERSVKRPEVFAVAVSKGLATCMTV